MIKYRYYAYNLLAELNQPGEYYLNRSTGMLYFYPPAQDSNTDTYHFLKYKFIFFFF